MSHDEHDHPAAAYYAPATGAPAVTKDLTALGVLAFVTAAIATVCTCVVALVLPRAARIRAGRGLTSRLESGPLLLRTALRCSVWARASSPARCGCTRLARTPRSCSDGRHTLARAGWGGWVTPVGGAVVPVPGLRDFLRPSRHETARPDRFLVGAVLPPVVSDLAQPPATPSFSRERA